MWYEMDEIRFKSLENEVATLNRRVTDQDAKQAATDVFLIAMKKTTDSHDEMATVAREVIDLLKTLIKYLSWVGIAAKWVSAVVVAFTAAWHGVKWLMAKVWFLQ